MSDYKPGDVAMVTAYNRRKPYRAFYDGKTWREYGANAFCVDVPATISQLLVLDIDAANPDAPRSLKIGNLIGTLRKDRVYISNSDFADQIEAQTKPTKPAEPTGLGAVVEDAKGYVYVRGYEVSDTFTHPWHVIDPCANACMAWWKYADIDVARVVSEGVTA